MNISPYLLIPILTLAIRQVLNLLAARSLKKLPWGRLVDFKDKPYWLSVAVWSLVPATIFVDGADSPWLATNLVLGILVLSFSRTIDKSFYQRLYAMGLGLAGGALFSYTYWRNDLDWLLARPDDAESRIYLIIFAAVLVLAEILTIMMRRKNMRKLPTSRRLQRTYRLSLSLPAFFGLIVAFLQNQTRNDFLTDRLYVMLMFAWIIVGTAWAYEAVYKSARARLAEEAEHFEKQKKIAKKKKRKSKR